MISYTRRANRWARRVVAGEIPANRRIIAACRRHLGDLRKVRSPDYRYRFDAKAAARAARFVERCVYTKGRWAAVVQGQRARLRLEDCQCFIVVSLFGWLKKTTGKRRFRKAFIFLPRKNAKSELFAAICLYMLCADGEPGAEVYTGATSEEQAWTIFRPMRVMATTTPGLLGAWGLDPGAKNLAIPRTHSFAKPLIGKPGDGASPHCAAVDEYHEHATSVMYDAMNTGQGSREQPLLIVVTTAGDNLAGPCKALYDRCCKVVEGVLEEDSLFVAIWELDPDDDWTDWKNWVKVNPLLGVALDEDYLRDQYRTALQDVAQQNVIRTKHLNQWVSTRAPWFNVLEWARCARPGLSIDAFRGRPCWIGVDLASKKDLADVAIVFRTAAEPAAEGQPPTRDRYHMFWRHYLPEATVLLPQNEHYRTWQKLGRLIVTDGNITDFRTIIADLLELAKLVEIQEIAYDPFQATMFATEMASTGLVLVEYGAIVRLFTDPLKEFDALITDQRLEHDGDPVAAWAASNVVAKYDRKDNVYPCHHRPEDKIDPIIAGCMALGRAMISDGKSSVYETRGVISLGTPPPSGA